MTKAAIECAGKVPFGDYSSARDASGRKTRRHNVTMVPYRCEHCKQWHLGTKVAGNHLDARFKLEKESSFAGKKRAGSQVR